VATFPFLERVKNPYTGGFAKLEGSGPSMDADRGPLKGSPGNFFFVEHSFLPWYVVFGPDGYGLHYVPVNIPVGSCSPETLRLNEKMAQTAKQTGASR
jgi:hypothetical protein